MTELKGMAKDYNKFSEVQKGVQAHAGELLVKAIDSLVLSSSAEELFCIVDYGCAGGKNSLGPVRAIIEGMWKRSKAQREVSVILNDLPTNDFNITMKVFHEDPYFASVEEKVFVTCRGKSFYEPVLHSHSVDFGFSFICLHWLSKVPCLLKDAALIHDSKNEEAKKLFAEQAATDLNHFLKQRARELKPNAKLLLISLARTNPDSTGQETFSAQLHLKDFRLILLDLVNEGRLTREEVEGIAVPILHRTVEEMKQGFKEVEDLFQLDSLEGSIAPCPYYAKFLANGNKDPTQFRFHILETVNTLIKGQIIDHLTKTRPHEEAESLYTEASARFGRLIEQTPEKYKIDLIVCFALATRK